MKIHTFDGREINQLLIDLVMQELGPAARSCNFAAVLECLIDELIYPSIDYPYEQAGAVLKAYGIHPDVSEDIIGTLTHSLVPFKNLLVFMYPNSSIDAGGFYLRSQIDEYGMIHISTVIAGVDDQGADQVCQHELRQLYMDSVANGDYIPPRQRLHN